MCCRFARRKYIRKGMVLLARKNESTSEKIVRLYKEGCSVDEIARVMEIPKGNIPNILEKHFPDYQNYVQPEKRHDIELEKPAKKGCGSFAAGTLAVVCLAGAALAIVRKKH